MKSLKNVMSETKSQFYRFRVFIKDQGSEKRKTVGMAYIHEDQTIFTVRLWTFLNEKFFLVPNKEDPKKYYVYTREPNNSQSSTNKYFWNIVGNAEANTSQSELEISFDLFDKTIFLNMYPEDSANPKGIAPISKEENLAA